MVEQLGESGNFLLRLIRVHEDSSLEHHGTFAGAQLVANDIGGIVATHDVSGLRIGSARNCATIAA
jgi:hypothetical protein